MKFAKLPTSPSTTANPSEEPTDDPWALFVVIYSGRCCWVIDSHLIKLEIKQKRYLKIITNNPIDTRSTPLFFYLKLLKLKDIYKLKMATEVKRIIDNDLTNQYNLNFTYNIHDYNTRSSATEKLVTPSVHTNTGISSFNFQTTNIWNQLPQTFFK